MSDITGTWNLTMRTPIGSIRADLTFRDVDGTLTGVAAGEHETVPLRDLQIEPVEEGERVRWTQTITKPMRLTLDFDVTRTGDTMTGHSRAGRLPRSTVAGHRA